MSVQAVVAAQARYWAEAGPGKTYGGAYSVGYSQPNRATVYQHSDDKGWLTATADADCSSLVAGAVNYGLHAAYGVPWGHPALLKIDDYWTGNLREGLEARGFPEVPWDEADAYPAGGLQVGDVLLSARNEGGRGHVVVVTTSAGDLSEAWINSQGGDGWGEDNEPMGDQTGGETRTIGYFDHPDTQASNWTSCHRFDEARFLALWPEFAGTSAPTPAPAPAPAAPSTSSEPSHAHGVDVSSHQTGIDFSVVPADFVIVKVTEGTWYVNPAWRDQVASALTNGKRLGLYHFADDDDVSAQVEHFLGQVGGYASQYPLWLDWEADAVPLGPGAAQAWLDAVGDRTGTTPGFYTYQNVLHSYDWSAVAARYPLWVAGGPDYSDYGAGYMDPAIPDVPYWGTSALVHQYTEDGRLPGWGEHLDLNRLRDRAAWDAMVGATAPADTTTTEEDDTMKMLGLDFGTSKGYALLVPGLGAYSLTQAQADAWYRAGVRTVWVSGEDFNSLVADSWGHFNACFGGLAGKKDIEAATAEVLAAVKANATPKAEEAAA